MISRLKTLLGDRRGATAIEYGLILAMVVLAMMVALHGLARETTGMWDDVEEKVRTAS